MKIKALALISGGLDSILAAKLVAEQGIEVTGVHFLLPISSDDPAKNPSLKNAIDGAQQAGIKLRILRMNEKFLEILLHPKHGYGSGFNPCTDCHILMLKMTKELMTETDASFILSGEVVGQRPMSQMRKKLDAVEKESGLEGYLLRPLSALELPPTIPETNGWVDRSKLLGINGRKRNVQMKLASEWNITHFMTPAGGCLFTDKNFAARLREHIQNKNLELADFNLLKSGRHFRLPDNSKLVLGRNKAENEHIHSILSEGDILISPKEVKGPEALLRGQTVSDETLHLACEITASYCNSEASVPMNIKTGNTTCTINATRQPRGEFDKYYIYGREKG